MEELQKTSSFNYISLYLLNMLTIVKILLLVRKVGGLIPGPVKLDTVSPTARHRCDVSSELCCPGAKPQRWAPLFVIRLGVIPRV